MKTFNLTANITFKAKDLENAFQKLAFHFIRTRDCEESDFQFTGNLSVQTVEPDLGIGPEFAKEVSKFYTNLSEHQEALGKPFASILNENLWDLYSTECQK